MVETKGGLFAEDLRAKESAKIECGKAHFKALEADDAAAQYVVARSVDDVLAPFSAPADARSRTLFRPGKRDAE